MAAVTAAVTVTAAAMVVATAAATVTVVATAAATVTVVATAVVTVLSHSHASYGYGPYQPNNSGAGANGDFRGSDKSLPLAPINL